ncbi:MAG: hypothetical protein LC731_08270, partial [Acidobacteria bacterium]|nr:hypothetical protein [Acidobacteriota bacterium]
MSKTLSAPHLLIRIACGLACALLCLMFINEARAQSTNVDQPTPVTSNQIAGQIAPRDIGDSR